MNRKADIVRVLPGLLERRITLHAIGEMFDVSRQRIQQITKEYGWKKRPLPKKERRQRLTDLEVAQHLKFFVKRNNVKIQKSSWPFEITLQDIDWPTHCPMIGLELDYFAEGREENSVSFDRIDPTKGYIPGNVAIVSWRANRIKNDGTKAEHLKIAAWMERQGLP